MRLAFVLSILSTTSLFAQTEATAKAYLLDVSRVESWSFFEPFDATLDPDYTIFGNRSTLGVRVTAPRFDVDGAFQYAQLIRLPQRAIGPGALGSGGFYFFAAQAPEAYQLYFKRMMLRVKDLVPGLSVTAGRMSFSSGEESRVANQELEALRHDRLGARLIGDFEWSIFQRSFDGARADYVRPSWSATASLLFPTQGGYEESANPTMSSVKVLTAAYAAEPSFLPGQEVQAFVYHYRDRRNVRARPDNTGRTAPFADVDIATMGASHIGRFPLANGSVDSVLWVAGQTGRWYGQDHAALSVAVEGGFQWRARWRPWVRAGYQYASGDSQPGDARHKTFFAMLPSLERYSQSATYAPMNIRDTFVQLALEPHPCVRTRVDFHHLQLADRADRWYHGSGATSRTGTFFGFSGRASGGAASLGSVLEGSVDVAIERPWSVGAYVAWMRGGGVVRRSFAGERLMFFSLESRLSF